MSPEQIQGLELLGHTIIRDRYVVVDAGGTLHGLDDEGDPRVNRDKEGRIQDVFCCLPKGKSIRVFRASSQSELLSKISGDIPDITMEGKDEKSIDSVSL